METTEEIKYIEWKIERLEFEAKHFERRGSDIMSGDCYYQIEKLNEELKRLKQLEK